jgi:hypothetical protein
MAGTVALALLAGSLATEGAIALAPGSFTVTGEVEYANSAGTPVGPILGATVVAHSEGSPPRTLITGANGSFRFPGLSPGGVTLNVSAHGYDNASLVLFFSDVYTTLGTPGDPATIVLTPHGVNASTSSPTTTVETPFGDLEEFLASVWSSAVLLALATVVAGAGTFALARHGRAAFAVAGGAAAATAPAAVFLLEVNAAFPWIGAAAGATIGLGAAVAGAQAIRMAAMGRPLEPE